MKPYLRAAALVGLTVLLAALALAAVTLHALRARPGEWSVPLSLWRWQIDASVPTLLRWATHPLAAPLLDGRGLATRSGRWRLARAADGGLLLRCAPCRLSLPALGPQPLEIAQAQLEWRALGAGRLDGVLRLDAAQSAVVFRWQAELQKDTLAWRAELPLTPVAQLVAVFGTEVPEARRARIEGEATLALAGRIDRDGLRIDRLEPWLGAVAVYGLGTEALLDADPVTRCQPQPAGGRLQGWVPHAVVAAEDQRFAQHPGYEVGVWFAVWQGNARAAGSLQGASTLTQQLAKILYTGDERSATRKLREWLYAVEMERTLGKGRILQLYLALAPWGEGLCGAEAAARHYFHKPAQRLAPHEAAWLANLLVNPELQLRRWVQRDPAAHERAAWVLRGMRALPAARREKELGALTDMPAPLAPPADKVRRRRLAEGNSKPWAGARPQAPCT